MQLTGHLVFQWEYKRKRINSTRVEIGSRKEKAEGKEEGRHFTQEVTPELSLESWVAFAKHKMQRVDFSR